MNKLDFSQSSETFILGYLREFLGPPELSILILKNQAASPSFRLSNFMQKKKTKQKNRNSEILSCKRMN